MHNISLKSLLFAFLLCINGHIAAMEVDEPSGETPVVLLDGELYYTGEGYMVYRPQLDNPHAPTDMREQSVLILENFTCINGDSGEELFTHRTTPTTTPPTTSPETTAPALQKALARYAHEIARREKCTLICYTFCMDTRGNYEVETIEQRLKWGAHRTVEGCIIYQNNLALQSLQILDGTGDTVTYGLENSSELDMASETIIAMCEREGIRNDNVFFRITAHQTADGSSAICYAKSEFVPTHFSGSIVSEEVLSRQEAAPKTPPLPTADEFDFTAFLGGLGGLSTTETLQDVNATAAKLVNLGISTSGSSSEGSGGE